MAPDASRRRRRPLRPTILVLAAAFAAAAVAADWQDLVTDADRRRLDRRDQAVEAGFAAARTVGATPADEAPVRALLEAPPQPIAAADLLGDWRCRTIKVGELAGIVVYDWFACRISEDADGLAFEKLSGSQRVSGRLFPEGETAYVLLGGSTVNDEPRRPYSALAAPPGAPDPEHDVVARLTAVAPNHLLMLFPYPAYESIFDVYELTR